MTQYLIQLWLPEKYEYIRKDHIDKQGTNRPTCSFKLKSGVEGYIALVNIFEEGDVIFRVPSRDGLTLVRGQNRDFSRLSEFGDKELGGLTDNLVLKYRVPSSDGPTIYRELTELRHLERLFEVSFPGYRPKRS